MILSRLVLNLCLVAALLVPPVSAQIRMQNAEPIDGFVVLPYLQGTTQTGVTIMWETEQKATSIVEYGQPRLGDHEPNLERRIEHNEAVTLHEVRLEDLETGKPYFYRIRSVTESGEELVGPIRTFKTAVGEEDAYTFAIFSDSQDNPKVWGKVTGFAWGERPDFAIHGGDLVGKGEVKTDWTQEFFPPAERFLSRIPLFTVLGNHENDAQYYYDYFSNPAPEYYYSFDYGNARFFMIDTNRRADKGSEQYGWLQHALANSDKTWNFVVHHHPPYTSDENDYGDAWTGDSLQGDPRLLDLIELYERYGVDVVFYGHIHDYERSWPIRNGQIDMQNGVVYLLVGGAGGNLEHYAPTRRWHMAKVRRTHHFGIAQVFGGSFAFSAYDEDWRLFDSFELKKQPGITNRERFAGMVAPPAPIILPDPSKVIGETEVSMRSVIRPEDIYYTTDGSMPTRDSQHYTGPFIVDGGVTVTARIVPEKGPASEAMTETYRENHPVAAPGGGSVSGLNFDYYEGQWGRVGVMKKDTPVRSGTADRPGIEVVHPRDDHWGAVFSGYIEIPAEGIWTFETRSDDGSILELNGVKIVDNDGDHGSKIETGPESLRAGRHKFAVYFFEAGGGEDLEVFWSGPGVERQPIPASAFFRDER